MFNEVEIEDYVVYALILHKARLFDILSLVII